ncbi:arginine N-succinyltransferase [Pseudoduganella lurida]|uniref:arginine N-succinyltransferase n=1 Tax=Pseudoduganella lurida TaxID=1036180 RepID=UPI001E326857|nr:arginine N-succinyltransferase [Pseudoduganella lurida]
MRAARAADLDAVHALALAAGPGMTTLKADRAALAERLAIAEASFAGALPSTARDYVFVLEDLAHGRVAGIAAIKAAVGMDEPFYSFRLGALVHSAPSVGVYARHEVLYLTHDLTGCAELCSLFLHPDYRHGRNGRLLSKSRFLFIAQFPQLFTQPVFAEMRGFQDAAGRSPFWESLGRQFFAMDFDRADDLCQPGRKSYIAELMPRYPIYTGFLSEAARAAIGTTHVATAPARRLLEQEGLAAGTYIDIFDGGPVLQAQVRDLRATRESVLATVDPAARDASPGAPALVCNGSMTDFRVALCAVDVGGGKAGLPEAARRALAVETGCTIRVLENA